MLLSLVPEVSIRCDFRTLVQETNLYNLNCASNFPGLLVLSSGSPSSAAGLFSWAGKGGQSSGAELAAARKAGLPHFPCLLLGLSHPSVSGWETDSQGFPGEKTEHVLGHTYFIFFFGTSPS